MTLEHLFKRSWLIFVALLFFGLGQVLILSDLQLIIGLLSSLGSLILLYWCLAQPQQPGSWAKVLAISLLLPVYVGGAYLSSASANINNLITMAFFLVGMLLVFALFPPFKAPQPLTTITRSDSRSVTALTVLFSVAWVGLLMGLTIVLAKRYLVQYDPMTITHFFFPLRQEGTLNNYLGSLPFTQWARLWWVALYLTVFLVWHSWVLRRGDSMKDWKIIVGIYILANAGSLVMAVLSTDGLAVLGLQVKSLFFHYYTVAKTYATWPELWKMMGTYANQEIYQWVSFPSTHPPLSVVLVWLLIKLTGDSPTLIALVIGLAAWSAIIPMYWIGRELYHRRVGYVMAALYAVLPNVLLFAYASLDTVYAACLAWATALVILGTHRRAYHWMIWAGLMLVLTLSLCYVVPLYVPVLFMLAIMGLRRQRTVLGWTKEALLKALLLIAAVLLPLGLLMALTHGGYDYLKMFNYTMHYAHVKGSELRPWVIWSWLAPAAYFIHAGAVITALFILRLIQVWRGEHNHDYWPWIALVTMAVPFLTATSRGETDRQFMVLNPLVVGTAAMVFWTAGKQRLGQVMQSSKRVIASYPLLLALVLSFINAVVIEILTIDHW